ncbi:vesicle coat component [Aspergillus fumigatus]|nr:vesicle coat component [Aspergillus fumigatus]
MAQPEGVLAWNPAFRPEDNDSVATDLARLALDSGKEVSEITDFDTHVSPPAEEFTDENGSIESKAAISADTSDQGAPDLVDSNTPAADNGSKPDTEEPDKPSRDESIFMQTDKSRAVEDVTENVPTENGNVDITSGLEEHVAEEPHYEGPEKSTGLAGRNDAQDLFEGNDTAWMDEAEGEVNGATVNGEASGTRPGFWDSLGDNERDNEDDFFNQLKTQTKPIYSPPETEARFEEGIPLLGQGAAPQNNHAHKGESQVDDVFGDDEDDESGFFSEIQKRTSAEGPPPIPRKSTSQVIDSINAVSDSMFSKQLPAAAELNNSLAVPTADGEIKKPPSEEDLAARWQAELSDDADETMPTEDDLAARWQAELDDDDDDLLLDDDTTNAQRPPEAANIDHMNDTSMLQSPFGTPENLARPKVQPVSYTPHQPSTSDLLSGIPAQNTAAQPTNASMSSYFSAQAPPNHVTTRAESFAERSKEGYKSPYDIPEDLARPRRAVANSRTVVAQPGTVPKPPPRSSSIPAPPLKASTVSPAPLGTSSTAPTAPQKDFFEELPLPPPRPKSRPASSGRYTPNAPVSAPSVPQSIPPPANQYSNVPGAPQSNIGPPDPPQLQQPERLDPYSNLLAPNVPSAPAVPSTASRYSPRPPGVQAGVKPPPSPRYSPAPPQSTNAVAAAPRNRYASQPASISGQGAALQFQPRTSSPLAYHEKIHYEDQGQSEERPQLQSTASPPPLNHSHPSEQPVSSENKGPSGVDVLENVPPLSTRPQSPPKNPYAPSAYTNEFANRVAPVSTGPPIAGMTGVLNSSTEESPFVPPRRSQTQSPSQTLSPRLSVPSLDPFQRPASVHGSTSPTRTVNPYAPAPVPTHNRAPSQVLEFIPPTDGQQLDSLERWKGAPIFKFGFGGAVISCFPKHIPRYSAGQAAPMIKSCPGEVRISQLNDWLPAAEGIVQHPGPLKGKSKKKDLVAWLSSKIAAFENADIPDFDRLSPDASKLREEKTLLWKVIRVLVENDGVLEGSVEAQKSLRNLLFPNLQDSGPNQSLGDVFTPSATLQPLNAPSQPDAVDSRSVDLLRDTLVLGEREKAVWAAVDKRLWGHAMIIASRMDRSVWQQVVQEFVRREVRSATSRTESLAAFYEILAGNIEESIDELVPPSARAGLQMISKVDGHGPAKNSLDGLDSWRETVGLVLSNRSPDDQRALVALGRLLLSYNRTEAAHICFILSRVAVFGGLDDPQANIVLLGVDHQRLSSCAALYNDDSILLTEAYEFATSVLAGSSVSTLPHLLAFKLIHAWSLAERGRKSEAQQYCDAIAAALKATTKPSGYHNQHLFFGVDELSARLRETTSDGGSSWISRPSMEKVSGSMWAKFNSFVAGDDSDAASTGSVKAEEIGPFARVSGTPTISRSPSVSDIYGSYPVAAAQPLPATGPSRYQPVSQYAPSASPEQLRGRSSMDSQRSASFGYPLGQRRGSQEPSTPVDTNMFHGMPMYGSPPVAGYQSTPPQSSYMPLAPVAEDSASGAQQESFSAHSQVSDNAPSHRSSTYAPEPFGHPFDTQAVSTTSQPDQGGYMPPTSSGAYEPPSFESNTEPADGTQDESTEEDKPKKKSIMDEDDDEDLAARAAAIQKAERARRDREADEAFRKAAEADAKKPPPATGKKGWFSGWFGGKKDDNSGGGPIRAKLGEENSFYYDTELKKWVNKKDPGSAAPTRGTPPPPKGSAPPSRSMSGSDGPPPAMATPPPTGASGSRPSSSAGAPTSVSASPAPPSLGAPPPAIPRSVSTGAVLPTPPSSSAGAPPRPATSLSNASSIDDLLGAPQARKGPAARGKKKGRYVDVMAK